MICTFMLTLGKSAFRVGRNGKTSVWSFSLNPVSFILSMTISANPSERRSGLTMTESAVSALKGLELWRTVMSFT